MRQDNRPNCSHLSSSTCRTNQVRYIVKISFLLQSSRTSSTHLTLVKSIYGNSCEPGVSWDQLLPESYRKKWMNWKTRHLPTIIVPRASKVQQKKIKAIDLHVFGDASITGTAVAIYAVIYQPDQGWLSKKDLTILRLESVAMHMAANLSQKVKLALEGKSFWNIYGWTDSFIAWEVKETTSSLWATGWKRYKGGLHPMVVYSNKRKSGRRGIKRM